MNVQPLKANPEKPNEFGAKISEKLNGMEVQNNVEYGPEQIDQVDTEWDISKNTLNETATEVLNKVER